MNGAAWYVFAFALWLLAALGGFLIGSWFGFRRHGVLLQRAIDGGRMTLLVARGHRRRLRQLAKKAARKRGAK